MHNNLREFFARLGVRFYDIPSQDTTTNEEDINEDEYPLGI